MTLKPAPVNTGIVFLRTDYEPAWEIPALVQYVDATLAATSLSRGAVGISTIEHLMAALHGLGVDNAYVEVKGPEVPAVDGSASPFVFLLDLADRVQQDAPRRFIRLTREIGCQEGDAWIKMTPCDGCRLIYGLRYQHPALQQLSGNALVDFSETSFKTVISRARTFGFLADAEKMRAAGLGLGAGLHNAIVVSSTHILNAGGLRFDNEFAMHKILDLAGDLYLLGCPLHACVEGYMSGHTLNHRILCKLLAEPDAWEHGF